MFSLKKVYDLLPVALQNVAISLYGQKIKTERFGEAYRAKLAEIGLPNRRELSERKLSELVHHAYEYVPFYRSVMKKAAIAPDDVTLSNFKDVFPIVEKEDLRRDPEQFLSQAYHQKKLKKICTSGTTGTPLEIYLTRSALQQNYAYFHFFLNQHGLSEFRRSATFAGRLVVPDGCDRPPFSRKNYALKTLLLSSYHLSERNLPHYISELEAWQPEFIDSYPSAVYEMAAYIVSNNLKPRLNLKAIVTSSETLGNQQRQMIERAFGCPVLDYYGCSEVCVAAYQMAGADYVALPGYSLVEVVDGQGDSVGAGESGEVLCTGLLNTAMPLIRYRIGDSVKTSEAEDELTELGYFSRFESFSGRVDDVIVTADGKKIGRLDPIFKGFPGLVEIQVVQKSLDKLQMLVVSNTDDRGLFERRLTEEVLKRVGHDMMLEFQYTDKIPRNSAGKFRAVVSEV